MFLAEKMKHSFEVSVGDRACAVVLSTSVLGDAHTETNVRGCYLYTVRPLLGVPLLQNRIVTRTSWSINQSVYSTPPEEADLP